MFTYTLKHFNIEPIKSLVFHLDGAHRNNNKTTLFVLISLNRCNSEMNIQLPSGNRLKRGPITRHRINQKIKNYNFLFQPDECFKVVLINYFVYRIICVAVVSSFNTFCRFNI